MAAESRLPTQERECWGNPFYANGPTRQTGGQSIWSQNKKKGDGKAAQNAPKKLKRYTISLRARTLNGETLKVHDKRGDRDVRMSALDKVSLGRR